MTKSNKTTDQFVEPDKLISTPTGWEELKQQILGTYTEVSGTTEVELQSLDGKWYSANWGCDQLNTILDILKSEFTAINNNHAATIRRHDEYSKKKITELNDDFNETIIKLLKFHGELFAVIEKLDEEIKTLKLRPITPQNGTH